MKGVENGDEVIYQQVCDGCEGNDDFDIVQVYQGLIQVFGEYWVQEGVQEDCYFSQQVC